MIQPLQDTIDFTISEEKTLINDTVKLQADITAQVGKDEPPEILPSRIREMLNKLIPETETIKWNFSNMQRTKDETGYERVTLMATARVPETENYNLVSRAEAVSQPGLMINDINADTSIPAYMIAAAASDLRVKLATKAQTEAAALSVALGIPYRIQSLNFGGGDYAGGSKAIRAQASNTMVAMAASYGSGSGDDGTLGNAQKVTMSASVRLAVVVPLHSSYQTKF